MYQRSTESSARGQSWTTERYRRNAGFVSELGAPVLALLAPSPNERILDLGCGDGVLTKQLADLGVNVVGLDSAPDLLAAARTLGLDARCGDAQSLDFDREFDAVFSNAALHWMLDPDAVIHGVARALKPGGRFVGEFGGFGNVAAITVASVAVLKRHGVDGVARIPWYFPTAEEYRERLEAHGFSVDAIDLIPRPTRLPTDLRGWLETFWESFLNALPESRRETALAEVEDLLRPALCDFRGHWTVDYVRLRFKARLATRAR